MISENLKQYLIKKIYLPFFIALTCLLVFIAMYYYYSGFQQEIQKAMRQRGNIINQIRQIETEINALHDARNTWQEMQEHRFEASGLKVEVARHIIDELKNRYNINNLNVTMTTPTTDPKYEKYNNTTVEVSEISINCSSYLDVALFNFIDALLHQLPGYAYITYANMNITNNINKEIISAIKSGNYRDLVQFEVRMLWRDIKLKRELEDVEQ